MIILAYGITLFALLVYSYTQIDLNLTLSSNAVYQSMQQQLIYLGYFNRPLSAGIFIGIIGMLFGLYGFMLWQADKKKVTLLQLWQLVGTTVALLIFAYPAFSHDFFNYLFDPRIIVKYGQNPYVHKALDYPGDLWLRFMHWTHRTFPYGPLWLLLSVPVYLLGLEKLTLTMVSFKLLFLGAYAGNVYLIYTLLKILKSKNISLGIIFFALNPLILIESLVSPHLDSVMLFFMLLGLWLFVSGKKVTGMVSIVASAGIKFVTGILLPLFIFFKPKDTQKIINWGSWVLLITLLIPIAQREPYPWYFVPIVGLAALSTSRLLKTVVAAISLGTILRYVPYLYFGDYAAITQRMQLWLTIFPILIAFVYETLTWFKEHKKIFG